jgi:hypothetical protein
MNNNATPIETLFEKAESYGKTSMELLKLNAIDKSVDFASSVATRLVIFMVIALLILMASIGVALWIGDLLGKLYYGFFAVTGFYLLLAILLYPLRNRWIRVPVTNSILTQMLKKN